MTHPQWVIENCMNHPLPRTKKTDDPPPLCSGPHHPLFFDQFLGNFSRVVQYTRTDSNGVQRTPTDSGLTGLAVSYYTIGEMHLIKGT